MSESLLDQTRAAPTSAGQRASPDPCGRGTRGLAGTGGRAGAQAAEGCREDEGGWLARAGVGGIPHLRNSVTSEPFALSVDRSGGANRPRLLDRAPPVAR
jgi:hypothetical protein